MLRYLSQGVELVVLGLCEVALLGEAQAEADLGLSVQQLTPHSSTAELTGDGGDSEAVSLSYDALRRLDL